MLQVRKLLYLQRYYKIFFWNFSITEISCYHLPNSRAPSHHRVPTRIALPNLVYRYYKSNLCFICIIVQTMCIINFIYSNSNVRIVYKRNIHEITNCLSLVIKIMRSKYSFFGIVLVDELIVEKYLKFIYSLLTRQEKTKYRDNYFWCRIFRIILKLA